jgi:hypothetical protein
MLVHPRVIDLGWGKLKSALVKLPEFEHRQMLVNQYMTAFRHVETAALDKARSTLRDLAANIAAWVPAEQQAAVSALVDAQLARLT